VTVQVQLERYLSEFRYRLRAMIVARGAAAVSIAALVVTLAAVYLGTRQAFADSLMTSARLLLVLILVALILGLFALPLRALRRTEGVKDIEKRAPDFDGRVDTYHGLAKASEKEGVRSPFLGLLAEDTMKIARRLPVALRVPGWEISVPATLTALALGVLLWFAAFGPDNWRYGVRHLWAGWAISDTLPPQRVVVTPGDGAVRRGGDLLITAQAAGFDPLNAEVFALFEGSEDWESASMNLSAEEGFDFRFFAVREPLRYYVRSAGVRSPEYEIQVVDLPRVNSVKLTYRYPQWTDLETRTEDPGYDIRAVAGTEVEVEIHTDRPLDDAELVVNGDALTMAADGTVATATLEVSEEGEYFVSTLFNGDPVRLSDTYFIDVVDDDRPVVEVLKPGRDWRASNIEEVSVRIQARDDFGLDRLELHYAVNGGEWQVTQLDVDGDYVLSEEILYLEEIGKFNDAAILDFLSGEDPESTEDGLVPGDLISYFAEAFDRESSMRTDLFFVEVQPFNRSFSQSTQGGGGGGGGGGEQSEISQRQKEILVATWNLIREQDEQAGYQDEQQIQDNGALLAELQRTLAEQAQTLASRTRARQLTSVDENIQAFVQALESAAEAMQPAADRLAGVEFDEAVPSEQEALQYLLKAESVFTDIQVAMQQGGGGGGGGFAGRDLSELFELEMDLDKNQYETESAPSFGGSEEQEVDEAIAKLQELARRQESLAQQANRGGQLTEEERWQQDELRRETEELKQELEQLRQAAANQPQSGQQAGEQSGQQSGQQSAGTSGNQAQDQRTEEAIAQLDNALQAMDRASGQSGENLDPQQMQRSIEEARRQLDRALEQMTAQRLAAAEEAFSDLSQRSEELFDDQRQVAAELQQIARRFLAARERGETMRDVMSPEEAYDLADTKWEMQRALEELEQDIQGIAQQFRGQTPGASDELQETLTDLQRSQAIARLGDAAARIRYGAAHEAAALEGITTTALDDLQRGTERALALAAREAAEGVVPEADPTSELLAELQGLRRELAQLPQPGQPGQQGQQGQGGQQGQQGQGGQQAGGAFGGDRFGGGGLYDPTLRGSGVWDPAGISGFDANSQAEIEDRLEEAGSDLLTLGARLRTEGLSAEELEAVRRLGDALRGGLTGNPELIEQEFLAMLSLVENLELQLSQNSLGEGDAAVRTEAPAQVAQDYQEAVAEYFRRLSSVAQ
jgi:hypothetical protein